jgi:hypothetical protein
VDRQVSKSTKRGYVNLEVFEPSNPKERVVKGKPLLWRHRNGYWYILYGPRARHRVSTQTKDFRLAVESFQTFMQGVPASDRQSLKGG